MSSSDIEHFATMVSGCESIANGDRTSGDARYAFAVLKLHAKDTPDFGSVVGQEGFLDNVKKGASNTVKWVKQLVAAIGKWIKETFLKLIGKGGSSSPSSSLIVSKEVAETKLIPGLERALEKLKDIKEFDVSKEIKSVEDYITAAKKGGDLSKINDAVLKGIRDGFPKLQKKVDSLKETDKEDNKEASKLGIDFRKFQEAAGHISIIVKRINTTTTVGVNLQKEIDNGSVNHLRAALINEIEDNKLTSEERKDSVKYVEEKRDDLYIPYEVHSLAEAIDKNKENWDKDRYFLETSYLNSNFSKERVKNLVNMADYLRSKGVKGFTQI